MSRGVASLCDPQVLALGQHWCTVPSLLEPAGSSHSARHASVRRRLPSRRTRASLSECRVSLSGSAVGIVTGTGGRLMADHFQRHPHCRPGDGFLHLPTTPSSSSPYSDSASDPSPWPFPYLAVDVRRREKADARRREKPRYGPGRREESEGGGCVGERGEDEEAGCISDGVPCGGETSATLARRAL
jgi:hypothetical protein